MHLLDNPEVRAAVQWALEREAARPERLARVRELVRSAGRDEARRAHDELCETWGGA